MKAYLVGETSQLDRGPQGLGLMWVDEGRTGLNGPLGSRVPGAAPYCLSLALASRLSGQSENKGVHMGDLSGPQRMCMSSERARCQCRAPRAALPCYSGLTGRNFNEVVGLRYKNGAARQTVKLRARR